MTVWPVIERELRAQARLGFTYVLRVLGVMVLLLVCLTFGFDAQIPPRAGGWLFSYLNCTLFFAIWIVVPLLSADCISRERRDGTLGLLFLTPLKSRDIVLAKGFVHGTRALTLWLATLPVMTIPFLVGGVTWKEAVLSALINFSAICWALAAGVAGSSFAKAWVRAQLFSCLFAVAFLVAFFYLTGANLMIRFGGVSPFGFGFHDRLLLTGLFGATDAQNWWGRILGSMTVSDQHAFLLSECVMALLAVLALLAITSVGAATLRRNWQEAAPSARQLWLEEKLCTPVLCVSFFHRWMRRKLERNPIGWLEQRTWSGRLVTWGWFAVMISLYSAGLNVSNAGRFLSSLQTFLAWLLLGVEAVSAAGSFQRERETGVLELLLVSPLSESQIIGGRLRGLWGQFLPALLTLLLVWLYLVGLFPWETRGESKWILFYCASFASLPVIGLYCSLRRRNFISAFLFTLFLGFAAPFSFRVVLGFLLRYLRSVNYLHYQLSGTLVDILWMLQESILPVIVIQAAIAIRFGGRMRRDLEQRNFAFSKVFN